MRKLLTGNGIRPVRVAPTRLKVVRRGNSEAIGSPDQWLNTDAPGDSVAAKYKKQKDDEMANYMHQATSQRSSATDDLDGERHGGTPARMVDGLVVLAGLFTAISPWVVRGYADAPRVVIQNLVLGVAVAILGLALTLVRDRRHDPSWVLVPIGVWVLLAPWIVDQHPGSVSWTNVLTGIVIAALGAAATALLMSKGSGHQRERVVPEIR